MSRQQVGWYDGNRVHQMDVRPVGPVPHHLEHTAGWKAVYVEDDAPAANPLSPAALAAAKKFGAGMDAESLEPSEPVL